MIHRKEVDGDIHDMPDGAARYRVFRRTGRGGFGRTEVDGRSVISGNDNFSPTSADNVGKKKMPCQGYSFIECPKAVEKKMQGRGCIFPH